MLGLFSYYSQWIPKFSDKIRPLITDNSFPLDSESIKPSITLRRKLKRPCSRKNLVFLFGALINLTVRVVAYFHPMRMTYPIQPGPFYRAAPNWGKPAKHFLLLRSFSNWTGLTVRSPDSSSITNPWGKPSNLWTSWVYSFRPRVPSWIWIRWIQYATHRNNFKSPQSWLCRLRRKIPPRQPVTSSQGNIFWRHSRFIPQTTRITHSWTTITFLSLTSKHDLC